MPKFLQRSPEAVEHERTMSEMAGKDEEVDGLISTAGELVEQLRETVAGAAEALRKSRGEEL